MDFFKTFASNTLAGSGNQFFFLAENENAPQRSRCFYKVFTGGRHAYSFLFSNILDSTFYDGSVGVKNRIVDSWVVEEMRAGMTARCSAESFDEPEQMIPVLFGGQKRKVVNPGEFFATDPLLLDAQSGAYLCLEIVFSGGMIPCHEESVIPSFVFENGAWIPSKKHPFASMIGADIPVRKRIAFLGDSITQGIGTPVNSYEHWNAVFAGKLGGGYAYWNLGLGFGRADDAASDGAWLYKAKQNDAVFVCFGVNDILQGFSAEAIIKSLQTIADRLHNAGVRVIMQTVPPFDYPEAQRAVWDEVNGYIRHGMQNADMIFDCAAILAKSKNEPHMTKYGGHPDSTGCKRWGEELFKAVSAAGVLE